MNFEAQVSHEMDELLRRLRSAATNKWNPAYNDVDFTEFDPISKLARKEAIKRIQSQYGVKLEVIDGGRDGDEIRATGDIRQFVNWTILEEAIRRFQHLVMMKARAHAGTNYSPTRSEFYIEKVEGPALIRETAFERIAAEGEIRVSVFQDKHDVEFKVEGNLRSLLNDTIYHDEVTQLSLEILRQVQRILTDGDFETLPESVDINNFHNGRGAEAWLARERIESQIGVRFEDLPSGHAGSKRFIRVHFQGNIDRFLSQQS